MAKLFGEASQGSAAVAGAELEAPAPAMQFRQSAMISHHSRANDEQLADSLLTLQPYQRSVQAVADQAARR